MPALPGDASLGFLFSPIRFPRYSHPCPCLPFASFHWSFKQILAQHGAPPREEWRAQRTAPREMVVLLFRSRIAG